MSQITQGDDKKNTYQGRACSIHCYLSSDRAWHKQVTDGRPLYCPPEPLQAERPLPHLAKM